MARKLTPETVAYNGVIGALNAAEARLADVLDERNRLWAAANAIYPSTSHGKDGRVKGPAKLVKA